MSNLRYFFSGGGSSRQYARNYEEEHGTKDNACVVFDGTEVIFASEAERLSRIKHDWTTAFLNLLLFKLRGDFDHEQEVIEVKDALLSGNHHESHIYEVFYQSGFKESAVLVNDGYGNFDDCLTLTYMKEGEAPLIFEKHYLPHSPAVTYGAFAREIFKQEFAEGKLMGLAGYGKDNGEKYVKWDEETGCPETIQIPQLRELLSECMGKSNDVMLARDIAHTLQKNYEDTMVEVVKHLKTILEREGIATRNLCMSGGGVLNCPTNSRIVELELFDNYYGSPQPSDGCAESIGRAYRTMELNGEKLKSSRLKTPYLGVTHPAKELVNPSVPRKNPTERILNHIKNGGVVAWCQDGAEYGPRALGHRSFLADPTKKEMADALNKIKGREKWRPLAPIVPDRLFRHIFDVKNTDMCEYMLRTLTIREEWQPKLQAVCHIDGTTRPQLLKRELNPLLFDILMTYFEKTGVPCLVNTSLNINGYPIVETPFDFGCLIDEVGFMKDVPQVMGIFVEKKDAWEVGRLGMTEDEYLKFVNV